MDVSGAIEALCRLNTGVVGTEYGRHERPHKPALLLAAFDALASGRAEPGRVEWSTWLRDRFRVYFEAVHSHDDSCTPELPFYHLRSDGFWLPVLLEQSGEGQLASPPLAKQLDSGKIYVRFIGGWEFLVAESSNRMALRDALVSRYFPGARAKLTGNFIEPGFRDALSTLPDADDPEEQLAFGRSAAFRRKVIELYDYQCVACGLRVWLPEHEISFVDAAHIVPFSETRNDHPTNGLALCKNHHWALDQHLVAPDPTRVWRVSRCVDPRRSRGEEDLLKLAGQPLLAPLESAFAPDTKGLQWRFERLLA